MQASTQAFATAVTGAAMTVEAGVSLLLDSPGPYSSNVSLAVDSITVDRQLTTDMPDGTRLVTGYPAASADITLSGLVDQTDATKTIAWLLNPYSTDSPMYRSDALGAEVTVTAGVQLAGQATPSMYAIFTGIVDDYTVDPKAGTVTLTCLDYRTFVQGAVSLPSLFNSGAYTTGAPGGDGKLYSQFALDWILRSVFRASSWPAQRSNCVLAVSMRGSYYPEKGTATYLQGYTPGLVLGSDTKTVDYAGGTPGMRLTGGQVSYNPSTPIPGPIDPILVEFWYTITAPGGAFYDAEVFLSDGTTGRTATHGQISIGAGPGVGGEVVVSIVNNDAATSTTATFVGAPSSGRHYVGVRIHGTTVDIRVDGTTQTFTSQSTRPNVAFNNIVVTAPVNGTLIEAVQVTTEGATAPFNDGFTNPEVVLDTSLNSLTVTPDTSGSDKWAVVQQIAQAEGAVGGFDETGVFKFVNRNTLNNLTSSRTITPTYSLKELSQELGNSFVRNHIQIPVNQVAVQPFSTVWSAPEAVIIGAGQTYQTTITTANPIVGLATTCGLIPSGGLVSTSGYRASKFPQATVPITNLVMTVSQTAPTQVLVTVTNPNGFVVYLITPTGAGYPAGSVGQPALAIGARLVLPAGTSPDGTSMVSGSVIADSQWPPLSEGGAVTNIRGEQLYAMQANLWVQDLAAAQAYADDILEDLYQPRPLWRNTQIVVDPRLQIADRVTVADPDVTKITNDDAYIFGVHTVLSDTDWTQSLDLRAYATPGGWLLGVVGRSELAVTTYI